MNYDLLIPDTSQLLGGTLWGTVTALVPLTIQMDDDSYVEDPTTLVDLIVSDRVYMTFNNGSPIVLGKIPAPAIRAKGTRTSSISVGSNYTRIGSWTEVFDTQSNFDATTGMFVAPLTGVYELSCSVFWAFGSARRFIQFEKGTASAGSGTNTILGRAEGPSTGYSGMALTIYEPLTAAESVSLVVYADTSTNIRGDFAPCQVTYRLLP